MLLRKIFENLDCIVNDDCEIKGLECNSKKIKEGFLFASFVGLKYNGKDFILDAISNGAKAILISNSDYQNIPTELKSKAIFVLTQNPREIFSFASQRFYNFPDRKLTVFGITGTNGKTTISYLLERVLDDKNFLSGVIGTINYRIPKNGSKLIIPADRTTPEANQIYNIMNQIVENNGKSCIMEVSSHSLKLHRVKSIEFDYGIFTNLTHEHLDFHKTIDDYFQSKSLLFKQLKDYNFKRNQKFAVINVNDPYGKKIYKNLDTVKKISFSIKNNATYTANSINVSFDSTNFAVKHNNKKFFFSLPLLGEFNVENYLATIATLHSFGFDFEEIHESLKKLKNIPGRMEKIDIGQPFKVIVDYAHTPSALENVLKTIKALNPKRIITVFGCGGERDREKRPIMGRIAAIYSDIVILTNDNPRGENPQSILLDIEIGIRKTSFRNYKIIIDREEAIQAAIKEAQKDDCVLVAGKGHENYQIFEDRVIEFDDKEIIKKILSR